MKSPNWKSVSITADIYEMLKHLAHKSDRSVSKQLAHMVKKEASEKAA